MPLIAGALGRTTFLSAPNKLSETLKQGLTALLLFSW
jgi:hypothetical protein